jgi:outer membrane murein-binding lipoprotein Lpp
VNPRKLSGLGILVLVGAVLLVARLLAGCLPPEDVAQKAEHVVVIGSYERRLDRCREEAKAARSIQVYDACEREATRDLCASRPELRSKAFCQEVGDGGR